MGVFACLNERMPALAVPQMDAGSVSIWSQVCTDVFAVRWSRRARRMQPRRCDGDCQHPENHKLRNR